MSISPVLFMTVEGEPMSFFLRPGPLKCKLQPLITSGGGVLCNHQKPGVILLVDPEEKNSLPESALQRYVSAQYIHDCIEKEEQLELEEYRVKSKDIQKQPAQLNHGKDGRLAYTSEEDAAILNYVKEREKECGGNRLWQEMEKQGVTTHSWQSMKYRYSNKLSKKQEETVKMAEEDKKSAEEIQVDNNEDNNVNKPPIEADPAPQTHPTEPVLTEIDALPNTAENININVDPQRPNPLEQHEKKNQQTNEQLDECFQPEYVEAETSHPPQNKEPSTDPQIGTKPHIVDTTESEEDSLSAESQHSPKVKPSKRLKENQIDSKNPKQPRRLITRRQYKLVSSGTFLRCGKKLQSNSSTQLTLPNQNTKKTKPATSAAQENSADQPPPKRAKGDSPKDVDLNLSQSMQSGTSKDAIEPETDEFHEAPVEVEKEKALSKLQLARMEFFDSSESDEDETKDFPNSSEAGRSSATTLPTPKNTAANPKTRHSTHEKRQRVLASSALCVPDKISDSTGPKPARPAREPLKAHLFIFDSESQEENSQVVGDNSSASLSGPQPVRKGDTTLSLTQVRLEEHKLRIKNLMAQTGQDLASVTKALMIASGDFSLAFDILVNSTRVFPIWNSQDDNLLLSGDPAVCEQLQLKYGERSVAKRMVYLEVDGGKAPMVQQQSS